MPWNRKLAGVEAVEMDGEGEGEGEGEARRGEERMRPTTARETEDWKEDEDTRDAGPRMV